MPDTRTVSVGDEVRMIDFVIFLSMFLVIVLWKRWHIGKSDEVRSPQFSDHAVVPFSFEYCLYTIFRKDKLFTIILDKYIVDIVSHGKCHVRRDRPWRRRPGKDLRSFRKFIIWLEFEFHRDRRIIDRLICIVHGDFEIGYRSPELPGVE